MRLDSSFAVTAPIDQVWRTLMDFEKVAGCVPGAEVLNKLSEDAYQVGMKVKLGPVSMQYRGQMEVVERDEGDHRAVLKGSAKEARGQGTAQATAELRLVEAGGTTRGSVHADLDLSGRAAAMGKSVIGSVTEQMMGQFAQNLQALLNESGPAAPQTRPSSEWSTTNVAPVGAPPAETTPPVTRSAASAGDSLDALSLARGTLGAQLSNPARALQLMAVVAVIAYRLGQLATRRELRRWTGVVPERTAVAQQTVRRR